MSRCYLRNTGLVCPVGLVAPLACAAIRCEISAVEELGYEDAQGEPYYASAMPDLEPSLSGRQRVLALLERTLDEAAAPLRYERPVAVFVVLPELFAGIELRAWLRGIVERLESKVNLEASRVLVGGPTKAFEALALALDALAAGQLGGCIVAASDSWVSPRRILELERAGRLRRPDNPDGVTPGEAAACLIVDRYAAGALASLTTPGFGHEAATLWNEEPHRGDGLVEAARGALAAAGCELADVDARISDAAGESFDFCEQALLVSRLLERTKPSFPLLLPGSVLGEVGVAGPLCGVAKAVATYQRRYAAGPRTIVFARDHRGPRAAVVAEAAGGQRA